MLHLRKPSAALTVSPSALVLLAGCAAALLHGGLRAASLNVYINTKAMPDRDAAEGLNHRCGALLHRGTALADAVFDRVKRELTTL